MMCCWEEQEMSKVGLETFTVEFMGVMGMILYKEPITVQENLIIYKEERETIALSLQIRQIPSMMTVIAPFRVITTTRQLPTLTPLMILFNYGVQVVTICYRFLVLRLISTSTNQAANQMN
ncbi:hypothetical protein MiTa_00572 [Microcystis aeruginosa NIES-4264]|nr:hypothetical protein MiTa_00572 [Microcystis aeruginosa NIES-4264]